ncbi:MAG: hypothetical protein IT375_20315 [Polyangiaceae bacterium]|nr:hypothetical protein [Polyangiaceae bacterium]
MSDQRPDPFTTLTNVRGLTRECRTYLNEFVCNIASELGNGNVELTDAQPLFVALNALNALDHELDAAGVGSYEDIVTGADEAPPEPQEQAREAASAHSQFHRAVAKAGLSDLFTAWLDAEKKLAASLEVGADG